MDCIAETPEAVSVRESSLPSAQEYFGPGGHPAESRGKEPCCENGNFRTAVCLDSWCCSGGRSGARVPRACHAPLTHQVRR
jgi:hypothetical protein